MKIDFIEKKVKDERKHDIFEGVQLNITAVEYLIIIDAIRQFAENSTNHSVDIERAKQMIEDIEKDIKESEEQL